MVAIIFFLALLVGTIGFFYLSDKNFSRNDESAIGVVCTILGVILAITFLTYSISHYCMYSSIISLEADKETIGQKIVLYEAQKENMVSAVKTEAMKYVTYEEKVFGTLTPDNVDLLLVSYPQLRAIEAITQSIGVIKEYNNKMFAEQIRAIDVEKELLKYKKNKLVLISVD